MNHFDPIALGDIVQVDPDYRPEMFGGALVIVTDLRGWGIIGYVAELQMQRNGIVYVRVPFEHCHHTGGKIKWNYDPLPDAQ